MPTPDRPLGAVTEMSAVYAFTIPSEKLEPLQVQAAQEFFEERRK
jgi:hypothetical protein